MSKKDKDKRTISIDWKFNDSGYKSQTKGKATKSEVLKIEGVLYGAHKKLTVIESPYQGSTRRNEAYARAALKDSLDRGESPLASHLLYTQVLNDEVQEEREKGILAGLDWLRFAHKQAFYIDYGYSPGMEQAREKGEDLGLEQEERSLSMYCGEFVKTCGFIGFGNKCDKKGPCEHKSLTNNIK